MAFYLCIGFAVAVIAWVYYMTICFHQQNQREMAVLKDVVRQQSHLLIQHEKALLNLTEEEQSSSHLFQQLEKSLHQLEDRYHHIQSSKSKDYQQLSELIKKGFDHEEMMKTFGLSRGEIQLMKSLNKVKN